MSSSKLRRLTQAVLYQSLSEQDSVFLKRHVLYADHHMIVLNKPPGLLAQLNHRRDPNDKSVQDLTSYNEVIRQWILAEPYPVHRLDKGTTGCLVLTTTSRAAAELSRQLKKGTIDKSYLALVQRRRESFTTPSGRIEDPIIYHDGRGELHKDGKPAITEWKLLSTSSKEPISLLQLKLITGNKHQLRLHLSQSLNTPILGDPLYSTTPIPVSLQPLSRNRMFLHASEVFMDKYHPTTGKRFRLGLRAALPADFMHLSRALGLAIPDDLEKDALSVLGSTIAGNHELHLWRDSPYYQTNEM